MATWVRQNTNQIQVTDLDLIGALDLDNPTAPPDLDPAQINSVRFQLGITGAGFVDDRWTALHSASFSTPGTAPNPDTVIATVNGADVPDLANVTDSFDLTDAAPNNGLTTADWEQGDVVSSGTAGTSAWATYQKTKGADGSTLTIPVGALTVTIDYTPGTITETISVAATIGPLGLSTTLDASTDVSVASTLPALGLAASLDSSTDASVAASLPALGLAAQIDVAVVTVAVAASLGPLGLAASTESQADVSVDASLPALDLSANLTIGTNTVAVSASLPALGLSVGTTSSADTSVDGGLPALGLDAQINVEIVTVSVAAGLEPLGLSADLAPLGDVSVAASLPGLDLAAATDASGSVAVAGSLPALGLAATLLIGQPVDMVVVLGSLQSRWPVGSMAQRWTTGELTHT